MPSASSRIGGSDSARLRVRSGMRISEVETPISGGRVSRTTSGAAPHRRSVTRQAVESPHLATFPPNSAPAYGHTVQLVPDRRSEIGCATLWRVCGIAGELRHDGRPADAAALARMSESMAPRGPDGVGLWAQDGAALGHRRLSVIDLTERGAQPMIDPHLGLAVAFNGCIYNYKELRRELAADGYSFASTSDTEVLMKAYHRWGERFVERLAGMFAFVLVERESGRAALGRDRLGIKPLYLAENGGGVLRVASTLPALLAG